MRKTWMMQSKIGLLLYDTNGNGYFTENDMENYIAELLPTLPDLERLDKTFHRFYICGAVRKFMFFLDPSRTGKIRVQDILISTFLDDILDLRDEDLPREFQENNWFSAPTALRVYGQYLYLDSDHNGMLSKQEFIRFGSGTLTTVFIDRIFQECLTYDDELDYKGYLDIVLAMENKNEPQALQFLFRLLDINRRGFLDGFSLNYFFKGIQQQMNEADQEPVNFEDIKDEIFDMIRPADPCKITLDDLVRSGQGEVVINILIELNGFYSYENREVRPAPESADSRTTK
uniref:Serine/threonine-protein phosphatase 2A regulatory subunit B'' subunit gamma n=1 Tax=Lygus hesperus TaxID=30085 RepID=A0A0A9YNA7_LYGHE